MWYIQPLRPFVLYPLPSSMIGNIRCLRSIVEKYTVALPNLWIGPPPSSLFSLISSLFLCLFNNLTLFHPFPSFHFSSPPSPSFLLCNSSLPFFPPFPPSLSLFLPRSPPTFLVLPSLYFCTYLVQRGGEGERWLERNASAGLSYMRAC